MKRLTAAAVIFTFIFMLPAFAQQVDKKTEKALIEAINDEYKARALYQKVIDKFGAVRPFSNIIKSETRHIEMLKPLFKKYNVPVPKDDWYSKVPSYNSVQEACEAGVKAEIENVKMYDDFFTFVKEKDIRDVFQYLRSASQDNHLPAFQRCSGTGDSRGRGRMRKR